MKQDHFCHYSQLNFLQKIILLLPHKIKNFRIRELSDRFDFWFNVTRNELLRYFRKCTVSCNVGDGVLGPSESILVEQHF